MSPSADKAGVDLPDNPIKELRVQELSESVTTERRLQQPQNIITTTIMTAQCHITPSAPTVLLFQHYSQHHRHQSQHLTNIIGLGHTTNNPNPPLSKPFRPSTTQNHTNTTPCEHPHVMTTYTSIDNTNLQHTVCPCARCAHQVST